MAYLKSNFLKLFLNQILKPFRKKAVCQFGSSMELSLFRFHIGAIVELVETVTGASKEVEAITHVEADPDAIADAVTSLEAPKIGDLDG